MPNAERTEAVNQPDLKKRTKAFALRILKLVDALPKTTAGRALSSYVPAHLSRLTIALLAVRNQPPTSSLK